MRGGLARRALRALESWNGDYASANASGTVDPGVAIWEEFKSQAQTILVRRLGGKGGRILAGETSLSHQFDITNGEARALEVLGAGGHGQAATSAAKALRRRFETRRVSAWREPRRTYEVAAMGAASSPDLPFFDRGTWEQSVAMGRGGGG